CGLGLLATAAAVCWGSAEWHSYPALVPHLSRLCPAHYFSEEGRLMEGKLDEILDGLPEKPPQSCLESLCDFINELRRSKRTYREIAQILEEKCQLRVSKSTVHRFLRARSRRKRKSPPPPSVTPMETASTEINRHLIPIHTET